MGSGGGVISIYISSECPCENLGEMSYRLREGKSNLE